MVRTRARARLRARARARARARVTADGFGVVRLGREPQRANQADPAGEVPVAGLSERAGEGARA